MGLRVASLAEARERGAASLFDGAGHGVRPRPVDRGLHRVDGVARRPKRVAQTGASEAVGAPFRADEPAGGDGAAPAQQSRRPRALRVGLGPAARVADEQKDFAFAASAPCEIAFERCDRPATAREPQRRLRLGRVGEPRHRQSDPCLNEFPCRGLACLPPRQEISDERVSRSGVRETQTVARVMMPIRPSDPSTHSRKSGPAADAGNAGRSSAPVGVSILPPANSASMCPYRALSSRAAGKVHRRGPDLSRFLGGELVQAAVRPPEIAAALSEGVAPEALFDRFVQQAPPGSYGLMLQPYWTPRIRTPGPEARVAVIGFTDAHARAHLFRAILEGLGYALREGSEHIQARTGVPVTSLRVSGGGSQSDAAMQVTADIFNRPTSRPHTFETSGLGAAIAGAVGLRLHRDFSTAVVELTRLGATFEPNPSDAELYERLYTRVYKRIYRRLAPLYEELHRTLHRAS